MSEPSEILREEHGVIDDLLHVLNGMAVVLDSGGSVHEEDLRTALEIVVNFADKCHHAKEEKALFPVLTKASPQEGAILAHRLEGDHRAARKLISTMRDLIPSVAAGEDRARMQFAKSARTYASLLGEHIAQETSKLLPLIDSAIPSPERSALAEEFERIEQETGEGLHARYEHTIHELGAKYAPARVSE